MLKTIIEDALRPPKLKLCPFCGSEATIRDVTGDQRETIGYQAACTKCGATTAAATRSHAMLEISPNCYNGTDKLLACRNWNSRPGEETSACSECGISIPHQHMDAPWKNPGSSTMETKIIVVLKEATNA